MFWVLAVVTAVLGLLYGSLLVVAAPRSTSAVLARGLNAVHRKAMEAGWAKIPVGTQGLWPSARQPDSYEKLCHKYGKTLPAFSEETRRMMLREGHWPFEPPRHVPKAPGLLRVWPERVEPIREVKISEAAKRKIRRDFPLASDYALRIVREVVEVEEVEITSKSSAKVTVESFERRYYQPIDEPDISRILLDRT